MILEYFLYEKGLQPFDRNDRVFSSQEREDIASRANGKKFYTQKRPELRAVRGGTLKASHASTVLDRLSTKAVNETCR